MLKFELGLIADNVHTDSTGKLNVLGEFQAIGARVAPAVHAQCCVVARWKADASDLRDGGSTLEVEIIDEDGTPVLPKSPPLPMQFGDFLNVRGKKQAQVILQFQGLTLPRFGAYSVHFFIDGAPAGDVPFYLIQGTQGQPLNAQP
jgi:hypothetical protein